MVNLYYQGIYQNLIKINNKIKLNIKNYNKE